jgi:hypothetical protein
MRRVARIIPIDAGGGGKILVAIYITLIICHGSQLVLVVVDENLTEGRAILGYEKLDREK